MCPSFRTLVIESKKLGKHVIDRCNLTILSEPGYEWVLDFLTENRVEVVASLPYFTAEGTDRQRGKGVFDRSLEGLRRLNEKGYGTQLPLNLVYNPSGFFLCGNQAELEHEFKRRLEKLGIQFHHLYGLNNMPINRFLESLERREKLEEYMEVLVNAFNPSTVAGLMCRHQVSVGWDGRIYDCDFNQMLDMEAAPIGHLREFEEVLFLNRRIHVHNHCFGCTAGSGSSCGGELALA
jgi:radical SAM/Cys-rich protein